VLKAAYAAIVAGMAALGLTTAAAANSRLPFWQRHGFAVSLVWNAVGALLFTIGLQPYAAVVLFLFAAVKAMMMIKKP